MWTVIVLIVIGFGVWYMRSNNPGAYQSTYGSQSQTTTNSNPGNPTGTPVNNPNTFHSIFTQAGSHECSYEQVGTPRSSSVIYISDGEMRGEFRTVTVNGTSADLMIYNGGYLYTWKEGATVGTKTTIRTIADLPQVIPTDLTSGAIIGITSSNNVSWDCHDWIRDPKQFVIPSYIKFSVK